MKFCATMIALFALTSTAHATGVSYGFDGTLSDHFTPVSIVDPLVQSGGVLSYNNGGAAGGDDTEALFSTFTPSYNQSWTASIDVTVPASYDTSFSNDPGVEDYLGAGILAFFDFDDTNTNIFKAVLDATLEVNDTGRVLFSSTDIDGIRIETVEPLTTATSATLTLSFDSATKVLSISTGATTLLSVDTDDPATNWGMTSADQFGIGIFATSENEAVFSTDPLTFDNFTATLVPEPSTAILSTPSLGCLAFLRRRSRRSVSQASP